MSKADTVRADMFRVATTAAIRDLEVHLNDADEKVILLNAAIDALQEKHDPDYAQISALGAELITPSTHRGELRIALETLAENIDTAPASLADLVVGEVAARFEAADSRSREGTLQAFIEIVRATAQMAAYS